MEEDRLLDAELDPDASLPRRVEGAGADVDRPRQSWWVTAQGVLLVDTGCGYPPPWEVGGWPVARVPFRRGQVVARWANWTLNRRGATLDEVSECLAELGLHADMKACSVVAIEEFRTQP